MSTISGLKKRPQTALLPLLPYEETEKMDYEPGSQPSPDTKSAMPSPWTAYPPDMREINVFCLSHHAIVFLIAS